MGKFCCGISVVGEFVVAGPSLAAVLTTTGGFETGVLSFEESLPGSH